MNALKGLILAAGTSDGELARTIGGHSTLALPIGNWPLVRYGLEALQAAGADEIAVLAAPPAYADVHGLGAEVIEVGAEASPVEALLAARDFLGDSPALVHRADGLLLSCLGPLAATSAHDDVEVGLLVPARARDAAGESGGLRLVASPTIPAGDEDLAPAFFLGPGALPRIASAHDSGGRRAARSVAELARAVVAEGGRVTVGPAAGAWSYRDDIDELLEGNRLALDAIERDVPAERSPDARIEGRVVLHPSAVVERTTIRGPVVVGAGAVLLDAFVGPYTAIGEHAHIEGTEIEHSIVLGGATIRHLGQRVSSSIVGREAMVRRELALPAALRLRVGRRAEVVLA